MHLCDKNSPHPLLDLDWIRQRLGDPSLSLEECIKSQDEVGPNILFDTEYYRRTYGTEIPNGMSCLEHFCRQSKEVPRNPNALFSTKQWHETIGWRIEASSGWRQVLFRTLGEEARFSRQERQRYEAGEIVVADETFGEAPATKQEICLFVHYDKHDDVQPYVLNYLDALRERGFCIVFLSNSAKLQSQARDSLRNRVWRLITSTNRAYDWGLYFIGANLLAKKYPENPILLANDSVVYIGTGLDELLARARTDPSCVTGAVDSLLHDWHVQSFFIYCGAEVVKSEAWRNFWKVYRHHNDKWFVINSQEMGFSRWMTSQGVRMKGAWEYNKIIHEAVHHPASDWRNQLVKSKGITNPTVELWDVLLEEGFPFVKKSIFTGQIAANNLERMCNVISHLASRRD